MLTEQCSTVKAITEANAVAIAPEHLALDYHSKDENGEAVEFEGRSKARVLRNRFERCTRVLEHFVTFSKVKRSSGVGGVGRTCTLREHAKDSEIRGSFLGAYLR